MRRIVILLVFIIICLFNSHGVFGTPIRLYTSITELSNNGLYKNHGITKNIILIGIIDDRPIDFHRPLFLRINNPHINKISVANRSLKSIIYTGDNGIFSNRPIATNDFIIPLKSFLNRGDTIELMLNKTNENVSYQLKVIDEDQLEKLKSTQMFYLGSALLFILILIICFIILGILSHTLYNYLFAIYILAMGIWFLNNAGFLYQFCWPNNPHFHNISRTLFSTFSITSFSVFILDYFKKNRNVFYYLILYIIAIFMPVRIISILFSRNIIQNENLKYLLLIINSFVLSILFLSIIIFILSKSYRNKKWFNNTGYLLYSSSLFLEVSHQYNIDILPVYHHSLFFPLLFLCGQILLIGIDNLLIYIKTNKLIAERRYQDLIDIDHQLANTVIKVQENERKIVGEELHDKVGSDLSIIKIQTETLVKRYPHFEGKADLQGISDNINTLIKEVRFIISSLLSFDAEHKKTQELFQLLLNHFQAVSAFNISFTYGLAYHLPTIINIQLYRILSEMLTNTLKYSTCSLVEVTINEASSGWVQFIYTENVKGFDYEEKSGHFGIQNIKHRVSFLKGEMESLNTNTHMIYKIKFPIHGK